MHILLWVLTIALAGVFLVAGLAKTIKNKLELYRMGPQMAWVDDFSEWQVRAIGVAEVLGALGLILPPLFDVAPVLAPVAAIGLALTAVGAIVVHLRRGEKAFVALPAGLLAAALLVAWARFGPYSF